LYAALGQPLGRVEKPLRSRAIWATGQMAGTRLPSGAALLDVEVIAARIRAVVPILQRIELTAVVSLDHEMEAAIHDLGHDHQAIAEIVEAMTHAMSTGSGNC
jgi:hypothetical protein